MNLNPKARFQVENPEARKLIADVSANPLFLRSIEVALLELAYQESTSPDSGVAAATHHRLAGARAFVHTLLNLSEPLPQRKTDTKANLDHTV